MRCSVISPALLMCLVLALVWPSAAMAQTKPHGPLFIRFSAGFVVGDRSVDLSTLTVGGFIVVAGVAFPIAHRKDMEIQADVSYLDYSGGYYHPGGSQTLSARAFGPTALYLYNFVRRGRGVMPFVGGGVNLARTDETQIREVSNPFFGPGTFESKTSDWVASLQITGGAQFKSQSRMAFRMEGRLGLESRGPLFLILGGISF